MKLRYFGEFPAAQRQYNWEVILAPHIEYFMAKITIFDHIWLNQYKFNIK